MFVLHQKGKSNFLKVIYCSLLSLGSIGVQHSFAGGNSECHSVGNAVDKLVAERRLGYEARSSVQPPGVMLAQYYDYSYPGDPEPTYIEPDDSPRGDSSESELAPYRGPEEREDYGNDVYLPERGEGYRDRPENTDTTEYPSN